MIVISLFAILVMAHSFASRKPLADRVLLICASIFLLPSFVCVVYPALRHHTATVFAVACFIWIVVCVATSYAFYELRRQLCALSCNENAKNLPALMGAGAVVILGIVACVCLVEWICA